MTAKEIRQVHNFIDSHGAPALQLLLDDAKAGVPTTKTAEKLGLSQPWVSAVKNICGQTSSRYAIEDDVFDLAEGPGQ